MDIRIDKLTLHNFKGVREGVFQFNGSNARLEGENGAGKSTVFDAFTWLLFGKDHQGQDWTNFDLKTIDPKTREPYHGLEHWVEAELRIDGAKRVLRRVVTENWVKPRGETERVLKGHNQQFFVDGVDTSTKASYDEVIHQWIDENVFKMLTNPLYFIDDQYTKWEARRKAILSLIESYVDNELQKQFSELLAEMNGEPMEQFKIRVAAQKRANKADLATATANIAAFKKTLPEEIDAEQLLAQLKQVTTERDGKVSEIEKEIAGIDESIESVNAANMAKKDEIDAIWKEINALRSKMRNYISERQADAQKRNMAHRADMLQAQSDVSAAVADIEALVKRTKKAEQQLEDWSREREELAAELAAVGKRYEAERESAFDAASVGVCPTCGQAMPQEMLEKKERAFAEVKRLALKKHYDKAVELKKEIASLDEANAKKREELKGMAEEQERNEKALEAARKALADLKEVQPEDLTAIENEARREPEFLELSSEEMSLQIKVKEEEGKTMSTADLLAKRREAAGRIELIRSQYERKVQPIRDRMAVDAERKRVLRMIADEERKEKVLADEVARLERLEFRATEYVKALIDSQEEAINALFRVARWKMFAPTLEGGLTEMCEVTNEEGVPYRSMNDAKKILCGLDVIRVFSEKYDCMAPIFIDNAESITRKQFDTRAQVIRLVVSEGSELTMYNE